MRQITQEAEYIHVFEFLKYAGNCTGKARKKLKKAPRIRPHDQQRPTNMTWLRPKQSKEDVRTRHTTTRRTQANNYQHNYTRQRRRPKPDTTTKYYQRPTVPTTQHGRNTQRLQKTRFPLGMTFI